MNKQQIWQAEDLGYDGHFISDGKGNTFDFSKTMTAYFVEKSAFDELRAEVERLRDALEFLKRHGQQRYNWPRNPADDNQGWAVVCNISGAAVVEFDAKYPKETPK